MNVTALNSLRMQGDPTADKIARDFAHDDILRTVLDRLHHGAVDESRYWREIPSEIIELLRDTATPPPWADVDRLCRVPAFYAAQPATIVGATVLGGILAISAVPSQARMMVFPLKRRRKLAADSGPTAGKVALLQGISGTMSPTIEKVRLLRGFAEARTQPPTATLGPTMAKVRLLGPLGLNGSAMDPQLGRAVQAIRLRHAILRDRIACGGWDIEARGAPIHQEDMLCTTMMLSVLVLEVLDRLGVAVTERQAADFYHAWRVASAMLGTSVTAIPGTLDQARELLPSLIERNFGPSPEGAELTSAMLSAYSELTPGVTTDELAATTRLMLGKQLADWADVPAIGRTSPSQARMTCDRVGRALLGAVPAEVESRRQPA